MAIEIPVGSGGAGASGVEAAVSWTEQGDDGVKHFSGTAVYCRTLPVPEAFLSNGHHVILDLGQVKHVAEVRVNGLKFPALWKPPYRLEVTSALRAGANELEIEVTNLWPID